MTQTVPETPPRVSWHGPHVASARPSPASRAGGAGKRALGSGAPTRPGSGSRVTGHAGVARICRSTEHRIGSSEEESDSLARAEDRRRRGETFDLAVDPLDGGRRGDRGARRERRDVDDRGGRSRSCRASRHVHAEDGRRPHAARRSTSATRRENIQCDLRSVRPPGGRHHNVVLDRRVTTT